MTNELVLGGELLDVAVLDHIVLGQGGRHVSMATEGLLSAEPTE
jgi:DNA repair protein RadC